MPAKRDPKLRLMEGLDINKETGCWVWKKSCCRSGYGQIKVFKKMVLAHRYSYEIHKGEIPKGMEILHECDNKKCINPAHLKAGTHSQNMKDAGIRGLMRKGINHPMFGKSPKRPRQANKVVVLGKSFDSQRLAERHFNLGRGTVRYWILNSPEKAQIISKGELNA